MTPTEDGSDRGRYQSSSNRAGAGVCDAVLVQRERNVGPMRLPANRSDEFIAQFNRTYQSVGMKLAPVEKRDEPDSSTVATNKKIPGSSKATGDRDSG